MREPSQNIDLVEELSKAKIRLSDISDREEQLNQELTKISLEKASLETRITDLEYKIEKSIDSVELDNIRKAIFKSFRIFITSKQDRQHHVFLS